MSVNIAKYSKAIAAGVAAIGVAVADGIFDFNDAWNIAAAVLAAVGVVYAAPANNK
jgi:flavorubredoxin